MDLRPCDGCGERGFTGRSTVLLVDGELCSRHTGPCRRCSTPRTFTFRLPEDARLPVERAVTFGGPEPSELLDPGEWLSVADLASRHAVDDSDLALAAAAVDEVLKFIPEGADQVPAGTFWTEDGRDAHEREPGRFRRHRLEAVAATYRDLAARMRDSGR